MSLTPTLASQIIADCRRRIDMRVSQFWTDADFLAEINKSLSQLDMILISKFNDYKLTEVIVTPTVDPITTAQNVIPLPGDFLKLRGLDVVFAANNPDGYIKVQPFSFKKRNMKPAPVVGPILFSPFQMMYRLQGATIYLLPASVAGNYTYRLWYTPDYVPLASTSSSLQSYMDSQSWYEYAVLDVCAKCQLAQDLEASVFMQQKEELKQMIIAISAPQRDAGEPAFVTDERGDWGGGSGYGWDW
jgi:hypothetical protein